MQVSVVKNFNQVIEEININKFFDLIKNGKFKSEIINMRNLLSAGDDEKFKLLKKSLPAITPSATFNNIRNLDSVSVYSNIMVLDIDKLSHDMLIQTKTSAINIPYTYACFISPSNNGLKIFVKTDNTINYHKQAFNQLKEYYETNLNISIDPSGKDITRLCFYSFDEELFLNSNFQIFKTNIRMLVQDIENIISQIENKQIDITNSYNNWLKIGFALADALGEGGRDYFHRLSKIHTKYNSEECNKQFSNCLNSKNSGITISTFFYYAIENGLDISAVKSDISFENIKTTIEKTKKNVVYKNDKITINRIENYFNDNNYKFRFNEVTLRIEVKFPDMAEFTLLNDYLENTLLRAILKADIKCNLTLLHSIIESSFSKKYDPFFDYLNNLPAWDNNLDYIDELSASVKTNNDSLWQQYFKKWFVAMVASLLKPEIINHTVIVLTGNQGIGKTTWCLKMIPPVLKNYIYSGSINPNNKDTLLHLSECMLINLDELENLNRSEIGSLKEIITKSTIRSRKSYGRNNENFIRRASFIGSVNTAQFLNDTTGSRRFLCFCTLDINQDIDINYDQLYAQALYLINNDFRYWFDKEEIEKITLYNEQFQIKTMEEEMLLSMFKKPSQSDSVLFLTATQILAKFAQNANFNATNSNVITLGKLLTKHGFEQKKRNGIFRYRVAELTDIEKNELMHNEENDSETATVSDYQMDNEPPPF